MTENIVSMKSQLESYFDQCVEQVGVENIEDMKNFRFAITMNFVQAYLTNLQEISKGAVTETEQFAVLSIMEIVRGISATLHELDTNMTADEKIQIVSKGFSDLTTPAYDMVAFGGLRIPVIEDAKNDFKMMAEFIS